MDSVTRKDCRNCRYYSTDKNGFWEPICIDCGDESNVDDPFPKWEPQFATLGDIIRARMGNDLVNEQDGSLTANVEFATEKNWSLSEDPVNHPKHYTDHPSGIECIQITEHMGFCLGNAIKYIWRAGLKSDNKIQDLEKAVWYIQREISKEKK